METMFSSCCSNIPQEAAPEGIAEVTMSAWLRQQLRLGALMLVLVLGWCGAPPRTLAAGVVGDGTPGSCTEAALDAALVGGGSVTFNCGASPVTITVTAWKTIATKTSLDGGGLITLSGGGATRVTVHQQQESDCDACKRDDQ